MKKVFLAITVISFAAGILLPGCASIVSHSNWPVNIRTDPAGMNILIMDKKGKEVFKGTSPATVTLKSGSGYFAKAEYQVKLYGNGFSEKIVPVTYKLNAWYFGNIVLGGVLGLLVIDPLTGAMYKIKDPAIYEKMERVGNNTNAGNMPALNIVNMQELSLNLKAALVEIK